MKVFTLLMTVFLLKVSASESFAQKVTLHVQQVSLKAIFTEIKHQTGYTVFYRSAHLKQAKPVSVQLNQVSLEEALTQILAGQPLAFAIDEKTVVIKEKEKSILDALRDAVGGNENDDVQTSRSIGTAQQQTITGRVTDSLGTPLANATVRVKGTNRATFTNKNGEFTLRGVENEAILQISYIGFTTREVAASGSLSKLVLYRAAAALEEAQVILNTGYEKISKERATGAFDYIDEKKLNEQVGFNILDRLNGTASAVIFDKAHSGGNALVGGPNRVGFTVRGFSTINGDPTPLIVVDNFPYDGDISNINPNDVLSITILKDAAAASIWGVRAGNGVIVITTKKGNFNQKVNVEFNANLGTAQKPDLMYLPLMSSSDYINVEKFLFENHQYDNAEIDPAHPALSPVVELLIAARDHKITEQQAATQIDAYRNHDVRSDYLKYVYQKPFNQQYALNLSGGSNNASYYISGGYDKNVDNLSAKNDRITLKSQTTFKPVKGLQIAAGLNYIQANTKSGKQGYGSVKQPYLHLADAEGQPLPVAKHFRQTFVDTVGQGKLLDWNYYPLTDWQHSVTNGLSTDLLGRLNVQYNVINGLNAEVNYQYERQTGTSNNLNDLQSYYTRDMINKFTDFTASNPEGTIYPVPMGGILDLTHNATTTQNIRGQLNFTKTWDKHSVTALGGAEVRQQIGTSDATTTYGYVKDPYTTQLINPLNTYLTQLGYYSTIGTNNGIGPVNTNRYVSTFANAAYTYNELYTISGSARRDATNVFGVSTNNKWKPLWSAGLAWNILKEKFIRIEPLSQLKLRATYGYSGNINPNATALSIIGYGTSNSYSSLPAANAWATSNPHLRWEQIRTINVGVDFGLKNGILNGSIDYYDKNGTDLFGPAPIDITTGNAQGTIIKNVANMHGRGLDVVLNTKNINRDVKWFSSFLFNYNTEKVTKYYLDPNLANSNYAVPGYISPKTGQPLYSVITYKFAGLDSQTGNPLFLLNGQPSMDYSAIFNNNNNKNDLSFHGSATPKFYGAMNNTISWKEISLNFNITYKFDYSFVRSSINYSELIIGSVENSDYAKRWQKPGDEKTTTVPSFIFPLSDNDQVGTRLYNASDALVEKGDHIRLQYVNLSYHLTKAKWQRLPFGDLSLYLNANNLWILWRANKEGIDPDVNNSAIPASKTISVGIRGNF